jgi:hypothetical protein
VGIILDYSKAHYCNLAGGRKKLNAARTEDKREMTRVLQLL